MEGRPLLKAGAGLTAWMLVEPARALKDLAKGRSPIPPLVESRNGRPIELVVADGLGRQRGLERHRLGRR